MGGSVDGWIDKGGENIQKFLEAPHPISQFTSALENLQCLP